jgi:hypothetical protein
MGGVVKTVGKAAGTIFNPIGSIVGGVTGGGATGISGTSPFDQNVFRGKQLGLAGQLEAQAAGQGPSLAQAQLQQATDQNIAQQMALAASARGGNVGMAQRQAAQNAAAVQQQAAQQASMLRMQEQMAAREQLGGLLGQGRAADQQGSIAQAELTEAGKNRRSKAIGGIISGVAQAGAAAASAASDEDLKTEIKPGAKQIESFLEAMKAHSYEYKDKEKHGAGKHVSPMAQELEKTELGKSMVIDTPDGKMVDYGKGFGAMLAANAALHERVKKLEGKKNG